MATPLAANFRSAYLVRRVAHPAWRGPDRARGRSGDLAGAQRRRAHHDAARHHGPGRHAQRLDQGPWRRDHRPAHAPDRPPRRRLLPGRARHLLLAVCLRKPDPAAAPQGHGRRHVHRADLRHVPQSEGARQESGHPAVGRRAADAGHGADPAHRRAAAAAGRDFRGPGAGDRAKTGDDDPGAQAAGLHHRAGGAELPLCRARWRTGSM